MENLKLIFSSENEFICEEWEGSQDFHTSEWNISIAGVLDPAMHGMVMDVYSVEKRLERVPFFHKTSQCGYNWGNNRRGIA